MTYTSGAGFDATLHNGLYAMLNALRGHSSWTVAGCGNGTSGGMGGGYSSLFTSGADFGNAASWVVFQAPDSSVQLLLRRYDSTATNFTIRSTAAADYSGGGPSTPPTSASERTLFSGQLGNNTTAYRVLYSIEQGITLATAGFFLMIRNLAGNGQTFFGLVPMKSGSASDPNKWVLLVGYNGNLTLQNVGNPSSSLVRGVGVRWDGVTANVIPALTPLGYSPSIQSLVGAASQTPGGLDVSFPIIWAKYNVVYKGVSDYLQQNGTTRTLFSLFANKTRVCIDDYNIPWDGTSTPT